MDLTVVAFATLGLSLFVSAIKMGGWILSADPARSSNPDGGPWSRLRCLRWGCCCGSS